MPIKHLATLLTGYLVAEESGRHTLVRLYKNIGHPGEFPATKAPFCFMVEFTGNADPFRIAIEGPPGSTTLAEGIADKPPDIGHEFQQWSLIFTGEAHSFVFPEPGIYSIVLYSGEAEIHRREFGVIPMDPAVAATSQVRKAWDG